MRSRSRLADREHRHDKYFKEARSQGFRARSVFKLEEIDKKCQLLKRGDRVLDLGCAPGSWLQYTHQRVGPQGKLVGIDRVEVPLPFPARTLVGDVFEVSIEDLLGDLPAFDVVMSDMAPDTSGIRSADQARSEALFERALEIAEKTLPPTGNFVGKLFMGGDFQKLLQRCRAGFSKVKVIKPKSSRAESIEQYVVALERKG